MFINHIRAATSYTKPHWCPTNFVATTSSDFKEENEMTTKGKVLVLVSSGRGLPLKNGGCYKGAGYYLNELTVPVRALMQEGYEITFANPKGNTPATGC
jgi:hypothetical protein